MADSFSYMALKATKGEDPFKYLGVTDDGYLDYSTDEVMSPKSKFAVESAHGHHDLVHIRSCSNNKYWVRSSSDENWIAAKATEKVDDQSMWNCTLFRMDLIDDKKKAKFYHVQSGRTVCIPYNDSNRKMFLCIDPTATTEAISMIFDYEDFVVLPKLVAFKGHNDLFYRNFNFNNNNKLSCFDSDDIGDPNVVCEILTTRDGHIRIKVPRTKTFWTRIPEEWCENWIGTYQVEENDPNNMFKVIFVEKNVVALRSLGNNLICRTNKYEGVDGVLAALEESVTKEAKLTVMEPVSSRTVKVLDFDIDNAKIYDVTPISTITAPFKNLTNQTQQAAMDLKITTTKSSTWSNSISVTLGVSTSFQTGIPFFFEGKIDISAEVSYQHQWGESREETQETGSVFTVQVPPMTTAVGKAVASKGRCDIRFSYVQIDHLLNGETIKTTFDDGLFTGVNVYNFNYSVEYIPIPPLPLPPPA